MIGMEIFLSLEFSGNISVSCSARFLKCLEQNFSCSFFGKNAVRLKLFEADLSEQRCDQKLDVSLWTFDHYQMISSSMSPKQMLYYDQWGCRNELISLCQTRSSITVNLEIEIIVDNSQNVFWKQWILNRRPDVSKHCTRVHGTSYFPENERFCWSTLSWTRGRSV